MVRATCIKCGAINTIISKRRTPYICGHCQEKRFSDRTMDYILEKLKNEFAELTPQSL